MDGMRRGEEVLFQTHFRLSLFIMPHVYLPESAGGGERKKKVKKRKRKEKQKGSGHTNIQIGGRGLCSGGYGSGC